MPSLLEQLHSALNQMNLDTSIPSSKLRGIQSHASIVREEIKRIQTQQLHSVQPNFQVTEIDPNFFIETTKPSNEIPDYAFLQIAGPLPENEEKETSSSTGRASFFPSSTTRFGVSMQGPNLSYHGHHHHAQELYIVLNGHAKWWTDTTPLWEYRNYSFHLSNENHAMSTVVQQNSTGSSGCNDASSSNGTLFFWSWTGDLTLDIKHSKELVQIELKRELPSTSGLTE